MTVVAARGGSTAAAVGVGIRLIVGCLRLLTVHTGLIDGAKPPSAKPTAGERLGTLNSFAIVDSRPA
jgi:hypothetical protein